MESRASVDDDGIFRQNAWGWHLRAVLLRHFGSGGHFFCTGGDSVVALETGATANIACFRQSGNRILLSGKRGLPRESTYPACARFEFGNSRRGEVRYAADTPEGHAGCRGTSAAFALEAEIPALLRKGHWELWEARRTFLAIC